MAMVKFSGKGRALANKDVEPRKSWVKVYRNSETSMVLIFNAAAVAAFGLRAGATGNLYFDSRRKAIGFKLAKRGEVTLVQHGSNENVLKVSMSAFYREHLEAYGVKHGDKFELVRGDGGVLTARLPRPKPLTVAEVVRKGKKSVAKASGNGAGVVKAKPKKSAKRTAPAKKEEEAVVAG